MVTFHKEIGLIAFVVLLSAQSVLAQSADSLKKNDKVHYMRVQIKKYPEPALAAGIEGVVKVELILSDSLCRITSKKVVMGLGYGLDEAALEVIDKKFEERLFGSLGRCDQDTIVFPISFRIH